MEANTKVRVRNRNNGIVGYTIPDMNNLRRRYMPGEVKEVTFEEIQKLSYISGGDVLLRDYLVVENEEIINEMCNVEPEYFYTDEEVKNILLKGSYDEFIDCLNFAPKSVIELIKKYAVELELNDIKKREAILEKTGYNVTSAVAIKRESEAPVEEKDESKTRRAATPKAEKTEEQPVRRAAPAPKYKVVSQQG